MGGIDKVACVDKDYEFTFTIAVGDSLDIPGFGAFPIDSIVLSPDTAIGGLPAGLTFECGTPDCIFRQGDLSCVAITGVPSSTNALGDYPLTITGTFFSGAISLAQTLPGDLFPGSYVLRVAASNDPACTASSVELVRYNDKIEATIAPNPVMSYAKLRINAPRSGTYQYRLYNMLGAEIINVPMRLQAGMNEQDLDLSFLSDGLYIYSVNDGKTQVTKRVMIRKRP